MLPERGVASAIIRPYRFAAQHVAAIICVSEAVRDQLDRLLARDRPRLVVIPNGVDLDRFRPPSNAEKARARARLGLDESKLVVGCVGRLHQSKRVDVAIDAVDRLQNVELAIAGTGEEEMKLISTAGDNVHFLGHLDNVVQVYESLDALLFCSDPAAGEGLPLTIVEAAAVGVPTIALAGSRAEQLVEELGGVVVDRSPTALASAIAGVAGRRANRDAVLSRHDQRHWLVTHHALLRDVSANQSPHMVATPQPTREQSRRAASLISVTTSGRAMLGSSEDSPSAKRTGSSL
jgi:glycosyltransferase involved in cell wall biosynthesis